MRLLLHKLLLLLRQYSSAKHMLPYEQKSYTFLYPTNLRPSSGMVLASKYFSGSGLCFRIWARICRPVYNLVFQVFCQATGHLDSGVTQPVCAGLQGMARNGMESGMEQKF